ncbi:MAG: polysaccharide biosynthesis/export family protein [Paludibacteraceae bacterium]|nr:polysaccharide biosynthesis/export family protein [Paludibacteraceae bacterium]
MKKLLYFTLLAITAAIVSSCASSKEILYLQNIDKVDLKPLTTEYEAVIKKDDRLVILVSGPDKMVCAPYNLTLGEMSTSSTSANPESATSPYLVDSDGNIQFPILGNIHVEGMTRNQLSNYLKSEIGKDVKDPIIYVAIKNYKITVLGEVRSPGTYTMDSEKITLLQALGRAGDLSLTAKRDGILLIREENGVEKHYTIDMKDAHVLDSPFFYLQQNDVIYVPAAPSRIQSATMSPLISLGITTLSTAMSITTFAITLSNNAKK